MAAIEVAMRAVEASRGDDVHRPVLVGKTSSQVSPFSGRWRGYPTEEQADAAAKTAAAAKALFEKGGNLPSGFGRRQASSSVSSSSSSSSSACTDSSSTGITSGDLACDVPPSRAVVSISEPSRETRPKSPAICGGKKRQKPRALPSGQVVPNYRLIGDPIMSGSQGTVYRAVSRTTNEKSGVMQGTIVAIKAICVDDGALFEDDERTAEVICRHEVAATRTASGEHVIRILETVEFESWFCIVMEFANHGELFDHVMARAGPDDETEDKTAERAMARDHQDWSWNIVFQLMKAVTHVHTCGVAHRDIKPENILVTSIEPFTIALADFGLAYRGCHGDQDRTRRCGSMYYAAPELLNPKEYAKCGISWQVDPFKCDVWSFAVTSFIISQLYFPVSPKDIASGFYDVINYVGTNTHPDIESVILKSLVAKQEDRATMNECYEPYKTT